MVVPLGFKDLSYVLYIQLPLHCKRLNRCRWVYSCINLNSVFKYNIVNKLLSFFIISFKSQIIIAYSI
jgi:hypothetical protein